MMNMDMGKIFGVKKPPPANDVPVGGAEAGGGRGAGENEGGGGGKRSNYSFDSTALERAAKAAREIENSKHAKEILLNTLKHEETEQMQIQAQMQRMQLDMEVSKTQQIQATYEEQRKTNEHSMQLRKKQADYEDELARRRKQADLETQERFHRETLAKQEESVSKQESMRRETIKYEAELRHEHDMVRVKAKVQAQAVADRENHDLIMNRRRLELKEYRETFVESVKASLSMVGDGFVNMITSPSRVATTGLTIAALAGGFYGAKYGAQFGYQTATAYFRKPSLVRETNRGLKPAAYRSITSAAALIPLPYFQSAKVDALSGVVVKPELEERLRDIAIATKNSKKNGGFYRNVLFHGPPGTGKSLFARRLAEYSGMDYAIMTGGDVAPMGGEGVTEIHKVFRWSSKSRRGVLLFIDEADAFLRHRSGEQMSESVRSMLNAFLYHTGTHSKKFMLVLATNQPEQLDWAMNDRIDEMVTIALPGLIERDRMLRLYFDQYILQMADVKGSRLKIDLNLDFDSLCSEFATATDGFSGREIAKMVISWQASSFASEDGVFTKKIAYDRLRDMQMTHNEKKKWSKH